MSAETTQQQRVWLDKLQAITNKPILIKAIEGEMPKGANPNLYNWVPYKEMWNDVKETIYTRSILQNELLLDPDVKDWKTLIVGMELIKSFCERENIPLSLAYSGGNGIHGDIIFDAKSLMVDVENFDKAKKYDIDLYKIVRKVLVDIIFNQSGANRMALAIDAKKINFSKDRMGSMVREYGTMRPNGNYKTLITTIPENKPVVGSLPLIFPEKIEQWKIPTKYNKKINEEIKKEIDRAIENSNYNFESIDLKGNKVEKFACIKTLFKMGATSGRYYGAGSIALLAKQCGYTWTATTDLIKKFFEKCEITPEEAKLRIDNCKGLFDGAGYYFSCTTMKENFGFDICDFKNCAMCDKSKNIEEQAEAEAEEAPQHIKERARKIQEEGSPIPFIMATFNKIHVGDDITGKTILASSGTQSVLNSDGIQPKLSAGSGKGKSHAVACMLHLMPQEYIYETSLSGKALFHSNELKPGTIIFSDDTEPNEDLQEVIKRSSTNFQKETIHTISVKDGSEWTTKPCKIPPRIVWCLTSVMDNGSIEYLNRQLNLSVDESTEQDTRVENFIKQQAVTAEVSFPITDDVLVCREIIRDIKTKLFKVAIPYALRVDWHDSENRRNLKQFFDLIKAFAVFDYIHRAKTNDTTIEANEEDFKTALSMYATRAINQKLKLNDTEIAFLKQMKKGEPYTDADLQKKTGKSHTAIHFLFHGRPGHGGGLLSKVPFLEYHPETDFIGENEIVGHGEYERERAVVKQTKPRHVYLLTEDFNCITSFGAIASLNAEAKQ